jgi:drug/metabolite transporter (DMT)-like permease
MIAILGGLGAAAAWAISTLCSSRSSRMIEPRSVVAGVMLVGFVITAPIAALRGVPAALDAASAAWLVLAGAGNVAGLVLTYHALRIGQVVLVAPLVSTEGAIAAVIALLAGETLAPGVGLALAVIAAGVCVAAIPASAATDARHVSAPTDTRHVSAPTDTRHVSTAAETRHASAAVDARGVTHPAAAVTLAMLAACTFGLSLYATGKAAATLPSSWVVLSARAIGTIVLVIPLSAAGRLRLTGRALPLIVASGVCEVLGFFSYAAGARDGIAVAAVLSSQFAAIAAVAAYFLFGERLNRVRLAGVVGVVAGVALLSALRA